MDKRTIDIILRARDEASKVLKDVEGNIGKVGNAAKAGLGEAVKGGAIVGSIALAGLGAAVGGAIANINESDTAIAQLEAVLRSTAGAAGLSRQAILDQATALSKMTTFGDEAVLTGQNLLLTFTNIKGPVMQEATKAMLDMSQALGQDTKSSAIQLGKALNDPIAGVTALRKVGVSFTEAQQDQIKALVDSGKTMDAQRLILKELNMEFGGSAEAAGKTFGGQLAILKNQLGEVLEAVGMFIVDALQPFVSWALKAVDAVDWEVVLERTELALDNAFASIKRFLSPVIDFIQKHSKFFIQALKDAALAAAGLAIIGVIIAVATSPIAAFIAAAVLMGAAIAGVRAIIEQFRPQLIEIWTAAQPAVMMVKDAFMSLWDSIANSLWPALQNLWNLIQPVLLPTLQVLGTILGAFIFGAVMVVVGVVKVLVEGFSILINTGVAVANALIGAFNLIVQGILYLKNNFWESIGFIIGFFATLPIKIPFLVFQAIMGAINFIRSIDWYGVFVGILHTFTNVMSGVKNVFMDAFNFFKGINWGEAFANVGKSIGNALISMMEGVIRGALRGLPGDVESKINFPRFASGGYTPGGAALTGEQGREIIMAPEGTRVVRNSTTEEVLARLGGGSGPTINVTVPVAHGTPSERQEYAVSIAHEIINAMRGQGVSSMASLR